VPKFRERMESRHFLRLLAEARRRYGGFNRYTGPTTGGPPAAPATAPAGDDRRVPSPHTPCEEPNA